MIEYEVYKESFVIQQIYFVQKFNLFNDHIFFFQNMTYQEISAMIENYSFKLLQKYNYDPKLAYILNQLIKDFHLLKKSSLLQ